MLRLGFGGADDAKKSAAKSQLDQLEYRANNWDIHKGVFYMNSGKVGMNETRYVYGFGADHEFDPAGFNDTRHELRKISDFVDWMDGRRIQADRLIMDMKKMEMIKQEFGRALDSKKVKSVQENFADRAVMALYGIDIKRHDEAMVSNDWDMYASTGDIGQVVRDIRSGNFGDIKSRLESFSSDWKSLRAVELAGRSDPKINPATVSFPGVADNRVFTQAMLDRYVAETAGRAAYKASETMCRTHSDCPVELPEVKSGGLDPRASAKILEFCGDLTSAAPNGIMHSKFAALDGAAMVARFESEQITTKQVERSKPRSRDTRDLDAACSSIESSAGPSVGFEL